MAAEAACSQIWVTDSPLFSAPRSCGAQQSSFMGAAHVLQVRRLSGAGLGDARGCNSSLSSALSTN